MIVVTGAAGFIGSNVVASLNERGLDDVLVCDRLGTDGRWQNLRKRVLADFCQPEDLLASLHGRNDVTAVIHMGAISSTTANDGDEVLKQNFSFTMRLLDWCTEAGVPLIYASSAATYGDGSQGFDDDWTLAGLKRLRPLNLYGWSKHQVDLAIATRYQRGTKLPPKCIGLKFFNVFGQNEYHKDTMRSVVAKITPVARAGDTIKLFQSHRPGISNGGQMRDFIYVDDVVDIILWLFDGPVERGIFNVGTGQARSFADLAAATFRALQLPPKIEYEPMPPELRNRYQYFTEARMARLRNEGFQKGFRSLEETIRTYVQNYLIADDLYR